MKTVITSFLVVLTAAALGYAQFGPLHTPIPGLQITHTHPMHSMGIATDGQHYYCVNGGNATYGQMNKYDMSGNFVSSVPISLSMRSIVYNNADGFFYIGGIGGDIYKVTDLSTGTVQQIHDNILQYSQCSIGISWDGLNIYDQYGGTVRIYNLQTGAVVQTLTGFQCGSYPSDVAVAADPDYIYTWNHGTQTLYVYDHSATLVTSYQLTLGNYGFSLSFLNGDIFVATDANGGSGGGTGVWYAHNIRDAQTSDLIVTLTPHNPPIQIPAGGGSFTYDASVENTSTDPITFDAWTMVILPNGAVYGPIIRRDRLVIPPGATILRTLNQNVPMSAPFGAYTYKGYVGVYPDSVQDEDDFDFNKLAGESSPNHNLGWAVFGWDDFDVSAPLLSSSCILHPCNPNPFNPTTTVSFELRDEGMVNLAVYDATGRIIEKLSEGFYPAGTHQFVWDASAMPSGVYFARLKAGNSVQTQKLLLVK